MKAKLEFDMPDDRNEHIIAVHAMDWALTVWDMSRELRDWLKHGHEFKTPDEALEAVQSKLFDIIESYNITLDSIT